MSRSQSLLYAVLLTGAALSLFRILYVGSRLKQSRWWAGESLLRDIWVPIILILFAFGIDFAIAFASSDSAFVLDRISAVWMAGIVLGVLGLWILLGRAISSW
jgi:hypothetical protein